MKENIQHHSKYVGSDSVIHKCLLTYLEMFSNAQPEWYITSVYDSCSRKGYEVTMEDIAKLFVLYRPQWKGKFILQIGSEFKLF